MVLGHSGFWGESVSASGRAPLAFNGMDDAQAYRDNPFVSLHVVKTHGCARQLQGQVWCWGRSDDGALGLGPVGDGSATTPQQ